MREYPVRELKAGKSGFAEGLLQAGDLFENLFVLGADITSSTGSDLFAQKHSDRFYSIGIAEQNIAGIAAGMALNGKIPVFSTYAVFSAFRSADQIRVSICYNNLKVIIGGAHAGISVGPDGATHQALEDMALMRTLPNMTVLSPCDATQAAQAVLSAIENINGPVYIRYGRDKVPDFIPSDIPFIPGKAQLLQDGNDVSIIATGHMTWHALQASHMLKTEGINAKVLNIHTIKPIDEKAIIHAAENTKAIVTAEEHQVFGGLGSAVSEVVVKNYPVPVEMIGINDRFGESGEPSELMEKYGLTANNIYQAALKVIKRKNS